MWNIDETIGLTGAVLTPRRRCLHASGVCAQNGWSANAWACMLRCRATANLSSKQTREQKKQQSVKLEGRQAMYPVAPALWQYRKQRVLRPLYRGTLASFFGTVCWAPSRCILYLAGELGKRLRLIFREKREMLLNQLLGIFTVAMVTFLSGLLLILHNKLGSMRI